MKLLSQHVPACIYMLYRQTASDCSQNHTSIWQLIVLVLTLRIILRGVKGIQVNGIRAAQIRHNVALLSTCDTTSKTMSLQIPFSEDFFFRQLFDRESGTYTYLLADSNVKEAVIIDPVMELADRDALIIKELGFTLKYAMNTHVHGDHITGTGLLKRLLPGCQSLISKSSGAKADIYVKPGQNIEFGRHKLEVRATPGHTNGCVTYVSHEQGIAFTGDTVWVRGCGRTDFEGGDSSTLYDSVYKEIFSLPDNFRLYPAHDFKGHTCTTVGEEKLYNPRLTKSLEEFIKIMQPLNLSHPKMFDKTTAANKVCGLYDL